MKIKKYPNGNQYILTQSGRWVRNFTVPNVPLLDLNNTISPEDHFLFINNEFENSIRRHPWINTEKFYFPDVIIVSDGYDFKEKHKIIDRIKNIENVTIIGVNGSLKKWACEKNVSFYLASNPYEDCLADLHRLKTPPRCIASCRTNHRFLENYKGSILKYRPVSERSYEGKATKEVSWCVDEYRNPICAAIGIAYRFGVKRLLLMCCDSSFEKERPGSVSLENGLWTYPQQVTAQEIIDANIYWLTNEKYKSVKVGDYSKGIKYSSCPYISDEEVTSFFDD